MTQTTCPCTNTVALSVTTPAAQTSAMMRPVQIRPALSNLLPRDSPATPSVSGGTPTRQKQRCVVISLVRHATDGIPHRLLVTFGEKLPRRTS